MSGPFRLLLVLLLLGRGASAQSVPTAPLVLRLSGGTRAMGLGHAFTAGRGPEMLFYNPAQLINARGSNLALQRFGSKATLGTFSTVGPFGKIWIGAGVQYLDYRTPLGSSFFSRPGLLPAGGNFQSASLAATIGAGFRFKGMRFGVTGKYIQERIGGLRDDGAAFDLGAAREVGRATIAVAVQNVGGGLTIIERSRLPTRVSVGAASPAIFLSTYLDLVGSVAVARERDGRITPGGGLELIYQPVEGWSFAARAGARRPDSNLAPRESVVTIGGSFGYDRIWLDYALEPSRGAGATHRLGIRIL